MAEAPNTITQAVRRYRLWLVAQMRAGATDAEFRAHLSRGSLREEFREVEISALEPSAPGTTEEGGT